MKGKRTKLPEVNLHFDDGFALSQANFGGEGVEPEEHAPRFLFYNDHVFESAHKICNWAAQNGLPLIIDPIGMFEQKITEPTFKYGLKTVSAYAQRFDEQSYDWLCCNAYMNILIAIYSNQIEGPAVLVGQHFMLAGAAIREAELSLRNKTDALRGRKIRKSASEGGVQRASTARARTEYSDHQMDRLVADGKKPAQAARIVARHSGEAADAIRQRYYRRKKKKSETVPATVTAYAATLPPATARPRAKKLEVTWQNPSPFLNIVRPIPAVSLPRGTRMNS